jgi:hypothetical protein
MSIKFSELEGPVFARNVTRDEKVTRTVTQEENSQPQRVTCDVTRAEFDALKEEVAVLRAMVEKLSAVGKPTSNDGRAAYMREYRKRKKAAP